MKKKEVLMYLVLIILIIILIIGVIFLNKKLDIKNNLEEEIPREEQSVAQKYYELEDRYIYLHDLDRITFTYKGQTKELKDWFKNDKDFLDKFIKELELISSSNDGGTNVYKDGGTRSFNTGDIVVIVCKRIDNVNGYNNNIHIGKDLKYENDVCYMPRKNI